MSVIYNITIYFYLLIIRTVSLFNSKAKLWIEGRKHWKRKLEQATQLADNIIWFHAASLGEFEQGRPLIEKIKAEQKDVFILLTFFSPSGYEIQKEYPTADYICYLPIDTRQNAKKFIDIVKPQKVFFIKYEFWFNYLNELKRNSIPLYLISGIFREQQIFFKPYGFWFRKQLKAFTFFYIQDHSSKKLLQSISYNNSIVTGDTRFDRVIDIAEHSSEIEWIKDFVQESTCMVIGSSWPEDEKLLTQFINKNSEYKYIIAPHQINNLHITAIEQMLEVPAQRFSSLQSLPNLKTTVLIIDNIGMLSLIYKYADIAYIGGAFKTGLHNILEAAVYGIPVVFGPNYSKFQEAKDILTEKAAFTIADYYELEQVLKLLFEQEKERNKFGEKAKSFIYKSKGAVEKIYDDMFRKKIGV